jgi:hypothetical protein
MKQFGLVKELGRDEAGRCGRHRKGSQAERKISREYRSQLAKVRNIFKICGWELFFAGL